MTEIVTYALLKRINSIMVIYFFLKSTVKIGCLQPSSTYTRKIKLNSNCLGYDKVLVKLISISTHILVADSLYLSSIFIIIFCLSILLSLLSLFIIDICFQSLMYSMMCIIYRHENSNSIIMGIADDKI